RRSLAGNRKRRSAIPQQCPPDPRGRQVESGKLNQSRCKQVTSAWVLELKRFATGFCTVTVENTSSKPRPPKLLDFLKRTFRCRTVIKWFPPVKTGACPLVRPEAKTKSSGLS